ncbi:MAG: MarR family transcriptional regulator [Robiginitomaculum sp.]|nr:MarR family transcriptional regulator [Robiginitomaculum sp.]MDQ7078089.1 MarR family transcriptional regulator [Robiginitomaculum sp.]
MSAASQRIYFKLQRAAHALNKAADRILLEASHITAAQAAVMAVITKDGPVTQKSIAKQLGLKEPALTTMANRLDKLGYVQRQRCPTDRRAWLLSLTPDGEKAFDDIRAPFAGINATLDAQIDEQEMDALAKSLVRIIKTF